MLPTLPSELSTQNPCSLILSHCNSNNLLESLWRGHVAELGVNCYYVADTDKSLQPHRTWLNYFGRHGSQFNHVFAVKITLFFTFGKKTLLLHKLHLHLIFGVLLWWHPQRTPVRQKEINLQLQRRSLWMPEGKHVLMQNNIKAGQSKAFWLKWSTEMSCTSSPISHLPWSANLCWQFPNKGMLCNEM